jgi:hypothetical protein
MPMRTVFTATIKIRNGNPYIPEARSVAGQNNPTASPT